MAVISEFRIAFGVRPGKHRPLFYGDGEASVSQKQHVERRRFQRGLTDRNVGYIFGMWTTESAIVLEARSFGLPSGAGSEVLIFGAKFLTFF